MFHLPADSRNSVIDIHELLGTLSELGPLDSPERFHEAAPALGAYARNIKAIAASIADTVFDNVSQGMVPSVTQNSFILGRFGRNQNVVRLNVWRPRKETSEFDRFNRRLYAYEYPHDHDFDLLTIGALGPGYRTTIYRYDKPQSELLPGDSVELEEHLEVTLTEGSLLYFEQSRDMHIQHACDAFSATINVMGFDRDVEKNGQFVFSHDGRVVSGITEYRGTRVLRAAELLLSVGADGAEDILREMVTTYDDALVKRNLIRLYAKHLNVDQADAADALHIPRRYLPTRTLPADWIVNDLVVDV